ncbi:hypothetical protein BC835DRAFT_1302715 [Cytidiella melzeri]|nr:hypothetical protein BC835DRAFT_1302715 [Cytidiella melzeri]
MDAGSGGEMHAIVAWWIEGNYSSLRDKCNLRARTGHSTQAFRPRPAVAAYTYIEAVSISGVPYKIKVGDRRKKKRWTEQPQEHPSKESHSDPGSTLDELDSLTSTQRYLSSSIRMHMLIDIRTQNPNVQTYGGLILSIGLDFVQYTIYSRSGRYRYKANTCGIVGSQRGCQVAGGHRCGGIGKCTATPVLFPPHTEIALVDAPAWWESLSNTFLAALGDRQLTWVFLSPSP